MIQKRKTIRILFITISVLLCMSGCKKEDLYYGPYLKCTVNGEKYRDQAYAIWNPSGAGGPVIRSYITDGKEDFHFMAACESESESQVYLYAIDYTLFLDSPLMTEKRYAVSIIPEYNDFIVNDDIEKQHIEKRVSYCTVYRRRLEITGRLPQTCFGTGYVEFTNIDNEKHEVSGIIMFKFLYPEEENAEEIITLDIQGEFNCEYLPCIKQPKKQG